MNDKKYQIFISSTFKDLIKARDAVQKTILGLYQIPIGMEMFSADDDEQWEVIKETIDYSDYYILIIGHRYGSEAADGISYTEKEFNYAKEKGIPILSFVQNRNAPTKPGDREDEPQKIEKLLAFVEKATSSKLCDFWDTEDQLSSQVAVSLTKMFWKTPRTGWIRSDKGMSPQVSEELAKLSKENRELNDELNAYRERVTNRAPDISISLRSEYDIEVVYKELAELGYSDLKLLPREVTVPQHLSSLVTGDDIVVYNSKLQAMQAEITEYNRLNQIAHRLEKGAFNIVIDVKNIGNLPANEVLVDICFPAELVVLDEYDWKNIDRPTIVIPDNPIEQAEEIYQKELERQRSSLSAIGRFMQSQPYEREDFSSAISAMNNLAIPVNRDERCSVSDNEASIRITKLIHTRKSSFDEIKLVPLASGSHTISLSVICEEYEYEKCFDINFEVK